MKQIPFTLFVIIIIILLLLLIHSIDSIDYYYYNLSYLESQQLQEYSQIQINEKEITQPKKDLLTASYLGKPIKPKLCKGKTADQYIKLKVEGGSLEPFAFDGNTLNLVKFDGNTVEIGDIVLYIPDDRKNFDVHKVHAVYPSNREIVVVSSYGEWEDIPYKNIRMIGCGVTWT